MAREGRRGGGANCRDDSELSFVNRTADHAAVPVSDPMLSVLSAAQRVSARSNGAFDVTVGPLVRLWGFYDKTPRVPTAAELAAVVNYRDLLIDEAHRTVHFAHPGMAVDLGGIAKGFAVEIAGGTLRRHGLTGLIDAGGTQYLVGEPPGKRIWSVGVKDPVVAGQLLGVLEVPEGSISTSADSSNFLVADGRRYGHILDPRSLRPSTAALSVTIVGADGTLADAMAKAAFILGPSAGLAFIDSFPSMAGLVAYRKRDGTTGIAISSRLAGAFHPATRR